MIKKNTQFIKPKNIKEAFVPAFRKKGIDEQMIKLRILDCLQLKQFNKLHF